MNIMKDIIIIEYKIAKVENSGTDGVGISVDVGLGEPDCCAVGDAGVGVDIEVSMLGA